LIAAIIIVGFVIGLATAVNSVRVGDKNEAFYDLADEVGFETKQVLDYGVFKKDDTNTLMRNFLETYVNYIAQEEVLFIYGNSDGLEALIFKEITKGNVGISTGEIPGIITIQYTTGQEANVTQEGEMVFVEINGIIYQFNLRQGQNFFFVIIKSQDDEKFVATG